MDNLQTKAIVATVGRLVLLLAVAIITTVASEHFGIRDIVVISLCIILLFASLLEIYKYKLDEYRDEYEYNVILNLPTNLSDTEIEELKETIIKHIDTIYGRED